MSAETQQFDRKSLRFVTGSKADFGALAADCVCFANASGGRMQIGIEDGERLPPALQRIDPSLLSDAEMLEDLIAAAFNDASNKVDAESKARMGAATAGMPIPPGMKLPF